MKLTSIPATTPSKISDVRAEYRRLRRRAARLGSVNAASFDARCTADCDSVGCRDAGTYLIAAVNFVRSIEAVMSREDFLRRMDSGMPYAEHCRDGCDEYRRAVRR